MAQKNIVQWNCRGLRGKHEELQLLINKYAPAIICLQEIMLKGKDGPSFPNYIGYHSNNSSIYVHRSISHSLISYDGPLSASALRVSMEKDFTICSLYLRPGITIKQHDLNVLSRQLPSPVMILGDLNGAHPRWGSPNVNTRGTLLSTFMDNHNLCLLNDKSPTSIHAGLGTYSYVDLSLASSTLPLLFRWSVTDDLRGSDHFPILLSTFSSGTFDDSPPTWQLRKADWELFQSSCLSSFVDFDVNDSGIERFTNKLIHVACQTIPQKSPNSKLRQKPWFTDECRASISQRKKALRRFRRNPIQTNLDNLRKSKARRTIRSSRKASWRKYVSTLNTQTKTRAVW